MTALSKDRSVKERRGEAFSRPVAADAVIHMGALVVLAAGFAKPGLTAVGLVADGVAEEPVDNTGGANGAVTVQTRPGRFYFVNSAAADAITAADVGTDCYVVDDQTVAKTSGTNTRSVAGKVLQVDGHGVLVAVGISL